MISQLNLLFNYFNGLIFALKSLSFLVFSFYIVNEIYLLCYQKNLFLISRKWCFEYLIKHGIVVIGNDSDKEKSQFITEKKTSVKLKEDVHRLISNQNSFETSYWLNSLLFEIFCTNKSRRLIDSEQEALLAALTRISRTAIESKLLDYQRDSWLFLSSLDLESFSFGDRLPIIQKIRLAPKQPKNSLALVFDISYIGGIKVGLKAAVAMNFRDFAASINFNTPSQFKLIVKMDGDPSPRISVMLSDLPAYEMIVTMRSQQLDRASNLLKLLIGNFIRARLCYPNYLTILLNSKENCFLQIANAKQYQSQLRVRLVSVNLNPEHLSLLPCPDLNAMAVLCLGETSCKTEIVNAALSSNRWNSIHTFNLFNGVETSPKILQVTLYQVIECLNLSEDSIGQENRSLNNLGRVEIPFKSITPGLLDIRTLPLSADSSLSTVSVEMYLHHLEEDGERDADWIFWNCPKPLRINLSEQDNSIEQVNWQAIKFVISKLSSDVNETEVTNNNVLLTDNVISVDSFTEVKDENLAIEQRSIVENENANENFNFIKTLNVRLDKIIYQLKHKVISEEQEKAGSEIKSLFKLLFSAISVLKALQLELADFSDRFNLSRPALSLQALPAHNRRLQNLLNPITKVFIPIALKKIEELLKYNSVPSKSFFDSFELAAIITNLEGILSNSSSSEPQFYSDFFDENTDLISSNLEYNFDSLIEPKEISAHWGDIPVRMNIDEIQGIYISQVNNTVTDENNKKLTPEFDFEGIFYSPAEDLKSINLASPTLFSSQGLITATWEISLLKNRFITFVPLGFCHLFPHRVLDIETISEVELVKDRDAFTIGFNSDLSSKEVLKNAKNGLLRITLSDGERIDLIGESRSCDQWFFILSCRIRSNDNTSNKETFNFNWKDINKVWLLPQNLPSINSPYALAIRTSSASSFLFTNFADDFDLYQAYCKIKTIWLEFKAKHFENDFNLKFNQLPSSSSLSSLPNYFSTLPTQSPRSQLSKQSKQSFFSFSRTFSKSSSSLIDPFTSRTRYDRLIMSCDNNNNNNNNNINSSNNNNINSSNNNNINSSNNNNNSSNNNNNITTTINRNITNSSVYMASVNDLDLITTVPMNWTQIITEGAATFNCTLGTFPAGYLACGPEYICYWLPLPLLHPPPSLFLLPRDGIQEISKLTSNWISSFSGIVLKVKRKVYGQVEPIVLTGFNNSQELELVYDNLLGLI